MSRRRGEKSFRWYASLLDVEDIDKAQEFIAMCIREADTRESLLSKTLRTASANTAIGIAMGLLTRILEVNIESTE